MIKFGSSDSKDLGKYQPVCLAEKYAHSEKFNELLSDGMKLVEESFNFLDGPGHEIIRNLDRSTALLYRTQSMLLTARLMKLASWLLLQRAVNAGEITHKKIIQEKEKINLQDSLKRPDTFDFRNLPKRFINLVEKSFNLQSRVMFLDSELYGNREDKKNPAVNPVNDQIRLLSTIFETINKSV